jgi:hypothetical protein
MANCYANLITLKGDKKQIQKAFIILGENFDLNNYWEKYDVYNNDNYIVTRMNDVGVLLDKEDTQLKYYIWTKWAKFENNLAKPDIYRDESVIAIPVYPSFSEWIGIDEIEILFYPAEDFEYPEEGIFILKKREEFIYFWDETLVNWEINWHRHSFNYLLEFELKLHTLINKNPRLIPEIDMFYRISLINKKSTKENNVLHQRKFSNYMPLDEFIQSNKEHLLKLIEGAKSRIINPPLSYHSGNGHVETLKEIKVFTVKYLLD